MVRTEDRTPFLLNDTTIISGACLGRDNVLLVRLIQQDGIRTRPNFFGWCSCMLFLASKMVPAVRTVFGLPMSGILVMAWRRRPDPSTYTRQCQFFLTLLTTHKLYIKLNTQKKEKKKKIVAKITIYYSQNCLFTYN